MRTGLLAAAVTVLGLAALGGHAQQAEPAGGMAMHHGVKLVATGEKRPARWVRNLAQIEVRSAN